MAKKPGDFHIYAGERAKVIKAYAESQHRSVTNMFMVAMAYYMEHNPIASKKGRG